MSADAATAGEEEVAATTTEEETPCENLHRLLKSRCALTVQAASKSSQNDGALTVILQLDTKPCPKQQQEEEQISNKNESSRLVEIELSPAQLFSMLAVLEEAHAKLTSKQSEEA